jgi:hypothetical protein
MKVHLHRGLLTVPVSDVRVAAHHHRTHRPAYIWALQDFQSRVRTTRKSSRNAVLNTCQGWRSVWRPPKLPTRAVTSPTAFRTRRREHPDVPWFSEPKHSAAKERWSYAMSALHRASAAPSSDLIGHACKRARGSLGALLGATRSAGAWPWLIPQPTSVSPVSSASHSGRIADLLLVYLFLCTFKGLGY